jgi:hypothetical protein
MKSFLKLGIIANLLLVIPLPSFAQAPAPAGQSSPTSPDGTILTNGSLTPLCSKVGKDNVPHGQPILVFGRGTSISDQITITVDMSNGTPCVPAPINQSLPNGQSVSIVVTNPPPGEYCIALETTKQVTPPDIGSTIATWIKGGVPSVRAANPLVNTLVTGGNLAYQLAPMKNTQATVTISCTGDHVGNQTPATKRTIAITYEDMPLFSASVGSIVSLLGKKDYGVVTTATSVTNNTVTSQYSIGVTSSSKVQFVPIGFLNLYGFGNRSTHFDFQAGLGINPNGSKTNVEYFLGPALSWKQIFISPGLHIAQAEYLTNGYTVGEIVGTQGFSVPTAYHTTLRFGIALSYSPKTSSANNQATNSPQ